MATTLSYTFMPFMNAIRGSAMQYRGHLQRETRARQKKALVVVVVTYKVYTVALKGREERDECVLAKVQQLACDFVGLKETESNVK